ncbi:MAG: hypothetical protein K9K84_10815 [Methylovulum sp.]|nr:hypothetical protein [Methylovulum sp.]
MIFFGLILTVIAHVLLYKIAVDRQNVPLFLFNTVSLILQTGQAFYMANQFSLYENVQVLNEYPTRIDGFILALYLYVLMLFMLVSALMFFKFLWRRPMTQHMVFITNRFKRRKYLSPLVYLTSIFVVFSYLVYIVGLDELIESERPGFTKGATLPQIIILALDIYFFIRFMNMGKIKLIDIFLALIPVPVFALAGSRTLVISHGAFLLCCLVFTGRFKISMISLIWIFLLSFFVLIIQQAIKIYSAGQVSYLDFEDALMFTMDTFYLLNTEAFAGFSGTLQKVLDFGFSVPDFGFGILVGVFGILPSFLKDLTNEFVGYITSLRFYNYSIIYSGLQELFIGFLFLSIPVYIFIIIVFCVAWDRLYYFNDYDINKKSMFQVWFGLLICSCIIHIVRGPITNVFVFGLVPGVIGFFWYQLVPKLVRFR